jgi:uncharacterized protein
MHACREQGVPTMAIVEDLFIYPLKSARGIPVSSARLEASGFAWDRHWMAVDSSGRFVSQRTHPLLARIVPELTTDELLLNTQGMDTLRLPLNRGSADPVAVKVWDDECTGLDEGDVAAQWVSNVIGAAVRVVRVPQSKERLANAKYAGPYPVPMAFADGFPLLICNRASLAGLNRRMPEPIPMGRFRPSIVLGGLAEFAEDGIDTLQIGAVTLRLVKPCTRCIITSTDQQTGERSTNPLPVLRTFRFDRQLLGVTFGENAVVVAGAGLTLERGAICETTADPQTASQMGRDP